MKAADLRRARNFIWAIKKGDLVKIKDYPTGREDEYVYKNGIVISDILHEDDQQIPMWESVDVYVFETGCVTNCLPASLEILSNS